MTEIISYSEVFKWDTCQRQYYYRFILGLKPIEESDAITTGVKGHKLLQNFYNYLATGETKESALNLVRQSAKNLIHKEGFGGDGNLLKAWTLVDNYIRETDFTAKAIEVENRFLLPAHLLTSNPDLAGVQIGFTPDVVFERTGGKIDVEDSKFVGRAWPKSKLEQFQQTKLYQIFLTRMGYEVSRSTVRFFNTQTGKISDHNYPLGTAEEKILIEDFVAAIQEVLRYRRQPPHVFKSTRRTMNYTACQFCSFNYPCQLEGEGKNASQTLRTQYIASDYDYSK